MQDIELTACFSATELLKVSEVTIVCDSMLLAPPNLATDLELGYYLATAVCNSRGDVEAFTLMTICA